MFKYSIRHVVTLTHLFLVLKVVVVLGHLLTRPLVNQLSAQQPDGQACHEHSDIREENSDTIACICTNNTTNTQAEREQINTQSLLLIYIDYFSTYIFLKKKCKLPHMIHMNSHEPVTGNRDYDKQTTVARIPIKPHTICEGGKHL